MADLTDIFAGISDPLDPTLPPVALHKFAYQEMSTFQLIHQWTEADFVDRLYYHLFALHYQLILNDTSPSLGPVKRGDKLQLLEEIKARITDLDGTRTFQTSNHGT